MDKAAGASATPGGPRAARDRRVVVVEDSPTVSMLCEKYLTSAGFEVAVAGTGAECLALLAEEAPAALLLDLGLPDVDGLDLLREITARGLPTSVVVITSNASLATAVEAMRIGAFDYLVKPFSGERITTTVRNAVQTFTLSQEVETYRTEVARQDYAGLIGGSAQMQAVYRVIESAATSRATVFITGESGTGKELCAHAVHTESPRANGPFIALNCAAIPRELMESEIFGHVRGAFTNATSDRPGAAQRAHGGTLFLDEICEMDLDLQAKILRLTQSGTFERVGGSKTESVDIRIVCATNRDPWAEVQAGRFREDLFYRLHVLPLDLPPLRDRGEDVLLLAGIFLRRIAEHEGRRFQRFSAEADAVLATHPWPGNVRELENAIHQIVALNDGEEVTAEMLPLRVRHLGARTGATGAPPRPPMPSGSGFAPEAQPGMPAADAGPVTPMWQVEQEAIERALRLCDGNVPLAAARLQIGVSTIYRKKAEWARAEKP